MQTYSDWKCGTCTLINDTHRTVCSACGTAKPPVIQATPEEIQSLYSMGFSEGQVKQALDISKGSHKEALDFLLSMGAESPVVPKSVTNVVPDVQKILQSDTMSDQDQKQEEKRPRQKIPMGGHIGGPTGIKSGKISNEVVDLQPITIEDEDEKRKRIENAKKALEEKRRLKAKQEKEARVSWMEKEEERTKKLEEERDKLNQLREIQESKLKDVKSCLEKLKIRCGEEASISIVSVIIKLLKNEITNPQLRPIDLHSQIFQQRIGKHLGGVKLLLLAGYIHSSDKTKLILKNKPNKKFKEVLKQLENYQLSKENEMR